MPLRPRLAQTARALVSLTAGIAWIGASFYFVWLDDNLCRQSERCGDRDGGIDGELWSVHGGGFYHNREVSDRTEVGEPLSGASALVQVGSVFDVAFRHGDARDRLLGRVLSTFLIDKSVMDLTPAAAIAISIASIVLGWLVYDALCRDVRAEASRAVLPSIGISCCSATGVFLHVFGARAAFIHIGAIIGTIMVCERLLTSSFPVSAKCVRRFVAAK